VCLKVKMFGRDAEKELLGDGEKRQEDFACL
jgi:hypothetical protein